MPMDTSRPNAFEHVGVRLDEAERIRRKPQTYLQDASRRFRENRAALAGMILLALLMLLTLAGPMIVPYAYDKTDLISANQGPSAAHWFGTDELGRADMWVARLARRAHLDHYRHPGGAFASVHRHRDGQHHRGLRRRPDRQPDHAAGGISDGVSLPGLGDADDDGDRLRRAADDPGAGADRLALDGEAGARADPVVKERGLRAGRAVAGFGRPTHRRKAHDSQHDGCNHRQHDLRDPGGDLLRGVFELHRASASSRRRLPGDCSSAWA